MRPALPFANVIGRKGKAGEPALAYVNVATGLIELRPFQRQVPASVIELLRLPQWETTFPPCYPSSQRSVFPPERHPPRAVGSAAACRLAEATGCRKAYRPMSCRDSPKEQLNDFILTSSLACGEPKIASF